jgi:uncharacterized RDD family membrane protein YckC
VDQDPYRVPAADVAEAEFPAPLVEADRRRRLVAFVADKLLEYAVILLMGLVIRAFWPIEGVEFWLWSKSHANTLTSSVLSVAFGVCLVLAVQGIPLVLWSQTWAKKVLDMRIVDRQGRRPHAARLLGLRYALPYAVFLAHGLGNWVFLLDVLLIIRSDRRCLHDHLAGTRVVMAG